MARFIKHSSFGQFSLRLFPSVPASPPRINPQIGSTNTRSVRFNGQEVPTSAQAFSSTFTFLRFTQLRPNLVNNYRKAGEIRFGCRRVSQLWNGSSGMFEMILFTEELVRRKNGRSAGPREMPQKRSPCL